MGIFASIFLLLLGLVILWKSGEMAVRNAIGFSLIYRIETFAIGFFIFSLLTALPEMSSALVSSLQKVPSLSAGDLLGSALVNVSLILGFALVFLKKVAIFSAFRKKLFATIGLIGSIFTTMVFSKIESRWSGILLILLYCASAFWLKTGVSKEEIKKELEEVEVKIIKMEKKALFNPKIDILIKLSLSLGCLLLSAWLTVFSAISIAKLFHIELYLLGATALAIGTSLPEMALMIHAVKHKEAMLIFGNLFGASLINVSLALGLLIVLNPGIELSFGIQILPFILAVLGWTVFRLFYKHELQRIDGYVFISLFLGYLYRMA